MVATAESAGRGKKGMYEHTFSHTYIVKPNLISKTASFISFIKEYKKRVTKSV